MCMTIAFCSFLPEYVQRAIGMPDRHSEPRYH